MLKNTTPKIPAAEYLLESANDSARHFRNVYLAYLTVMIYIFIIVLSTEQELLFRAGDKPLPLVHISVPIVAFFTWMPWILLVLHFYLLIQATFLSEKVRLYNQRLNNQIESEEDICEARMLLASVPLVHILVEEKGKSIYSTLLYLIVFVSLAVFPLMVLIMAQITFLPYQSEVITWSHRIVILVDLLMLWYFGRYILESHEGKTIWIYSVARFLVVLAPMFFIIVVFINFPGNKIYSSSTASLHELEWVKEMMPTNHFDLPNRKLVGKEPSPELLAVHLERQMDDKNSIEQSLSRWCQYADPLDLKNRNFREAQLQGATLCKAILQDADLTSVNLNNAILISANFTSATLTYANLTESNLERAILTSASLRDADLTDAWLKKADLSRADLRQADLSEAHLDEADLDEADLSRADLSGADLDEADLKEADLREANLSGADLKKANLDGANLSEANLSRADLDEADLDEADLDEADLSRADLSGADLDEADLSRADLSRADLSGADLDEADLREADLREADLSRADLMEADLSIANLNEANLSGANLMEADLSGADLRQTDLTAANLSRVNFFNAVLDERTTLDFTWVWELSDSNEDYFPIGIPVGWINKPKPKYLCPEDFDISDYIDKDEEVEREKLKSQLQQLIKRKCRRYYF